MLLYKFQKASYNTLLQALILQNIIAVTMKTLSRKFQALEKTGRKEYQLSLAVECCILQMQAFLAILANRITRMTGLSRTTLASREQAASCKATSLF